MKQLLDQLVKETIKPLLKTAGFKKSRMHFYHTNGEINFAINIQKSQGNSFEQVKFYINCYIHSTKIDEVLGRKIKEMPDVYYFSKRISSIVNSGEDGYYITKDTDFLALNTLIENDLKLLISFFDSIQSTADLVNLMIAQNGLYHYEELFEYLLLTENQIDLKRFVQQLHQRFGTDHRWQIFENNMSNILKKHHKQQTFSSLLTL